MGCFEYAVELRVTVLESDFDINIWRATLPRNVDVNSGRAAAGRNFYIGTETAVLCGRIIVAIDHTQTHHTR